MKKTSSMSDIMNLESKVKQKAEAAAAARKAMEDGTAAEKIQAEGCDETNAATAGTEADAAAAAKDETKKTSDMLKSRSIQIQ